MFRHDLSRLTIEEMVAAPRRVALHRALLAALRRREQDPDLLPRLAHHAEGARDAAAVRQLAPAAAARAAALGAHREAALQYSREYAAEVDVSALMTAHGRPPAEPYASELAGNHRAAAARWSDLGCPYEAARSPRRQHLPRHPHRRGSQPQPAPVRGRRLRPPACPPG